MLQQGHPDLRHGTHMPLILGQEHPFKVISTWFSLCRVTTAVNIGSQKFRALITTHTLKFDCGGMAPHYALSRLHAITDTIVTLALTKLVQIPRKHGFKFAPICSLSRNQVMLRTRCEWLIDARASKTPVLMVQTSSSDAINNTRCGIFKDTRNGANTSPANCVDAFQDILIYGTIIMPTDSIDAFKVATGAIITSANSGGCS